MSLTHRLIALYPRPFRDRWGPALESEAGTTGWRSSPDLARTLIGMWIHPVIWPATSPAQRRLRAAHLAFAVSAVGWLTGHAALELTGAVPRSLARSWILTSCDALMITGLALVLPLPRLRYFHQLAHLIARRLAVPALLGALIVAAANNFTASAIPLVGRWAIVGCWWLTLATGAIQAIRVLTSFDPVHAPGPRRLRIGLWLATLGLALSGAIIFTATLTAGTDKLIGVVTATAILGLALAVTATVHDLAEVA
ncbi:hypothetical protein [Kribbella sp. NPDC006257]|uniref:hypothetical protein n=1 Tax=Kribbella sp. NPDC006257 TaxID=3156738 RepID=UPI0033A07CDD